MICATVHGHPRPEPRSLPFRTRTARPVLADALSHGQIRNPRGTITTKREAITEVILVCANGRANAALTIFISAKKLRCAER
jgi:hypothetical protein